MEHTFYRFGFDLLNQVNPFDPFAPVYESYIDAFLSVKQKTARKFCFHLKDHAEYLIRKEIRECNRFRGEPELDIPAPEQLPWQFEIDQMLEEWTTKGILSKRQSELVIYRIVYEYTFKELEKKFKTTFTTLRQQFHRAIELLKPYLKEKYFSSK
jgi:DNA-directed RNA polymerase specialized sigma24 family protein